MGGAAERVGGEAAGAEMGGGPYWTHWSEPETQMINGDGQLEG